MILIDMMRIDILGQLNSRHEENDIEMIIEIDEALFVDEWFENNFIVLLSYFLHQQTHHPL